MYFSANASLVKEALESRRPDLLWLAHRRGPTGSAVIDMVGPDDRYRERREGWPQHWLGELELEPGEAAELFAHVAHDIRNNVFHGQKLYDDTEDRHVIEHLWPLLAAVIANTERAILIAEARVTREVGR